MTTAGGCYLVLVVWPEGTNLEPTTGRASAIARAARYRAAGLPATAIRADHGTGRASWQEPEGDWIGFFADGSRVRTVNYGPATFNHVDTYISV